MADVLDSPDDASCCLVDLDVVIFLLPHWHSLLDLLGVAIVNAELGVVQEAECGILGEVTRSMRGAEGGVRSIQNSVSLTVEQSMLSLDLVLLGFLRMADSMPQMMREARMSLNMLLLLRRRDDSVEVLLGKLRETFFLSPPMHSNLGNLSGSFHNDQLGARTSLSSSWQLC